MTWYPGKFLRGLTLKKQMVGSPFYVGQKVVFVSGEYAGKEGEVTAIDPKAKSVRVAVPVIETDWFRDFEVRPA